MVAKITVPTGIKRALNYNEQKVKEGLAECIYAHDFLKKAEHLHFHEKLGRFEKLIARNTRATTNTVHISLNFGLNEKIEREKLIEIAKSYMEKIGFGEQPFLVYKHHDAGHPHIHIVTTNIQKDGKRISLHNIGKNQSNTARKEIEIAYNLQKAEDQQIKHSEKITPINAQKVTYGKSATKSAITNVLVAVLSEYKYASLAELNAVLKLYNLTADRGSEDGIVYSKRGLYYRVLDDKGNKSGVPIKASSIYNKPTLNYLESQFKQNEILKPNFRRNLKTSIDWIMVKPPKGLQAFEQALKKEKISLIIRQNENGIVYGLTYIDHNTKCVFNGSDIGKDYSANAILERCGVSQAISVQGKSVQPEMQTLDWSLDSSSKQLQEHKGLAEILEVIIKPSEEYHYLPQELKKQRKKKRKPQLYLKAFT